MEPLPKIARERLRAGQLGEHPDADLLTAFAERSLMEHERSQVVDHLSRCADCRHVVALATPELTPALTQTGATAKPFPLKKGLLSWPVLRWGSLAACLVVVSAAVLLVSRRSVNAPERVATVAEQQKQQPAAEMRSADKPATNIAPSVASEPRQKAAESTLAASPPSQSKVPEKFEGKRFLKMNEERADKSALRDLSAGAAGKVEEEQPIKIPPASLPARAEADELSMAKAAPSSVGQLAKEGEAMDQKAAPASPDKDDPSGQVREYSESVEVAANAPMRRTQEATVAAKSATPKAKDERAKNENLGYVGGRINNGIAATASTANGARLMRDVSSARWTLSPEGLPQRSFDSGETWETVQVENRGGFRALSAQGMDVWVGGKGGLLYHSSDVGLHWTRVVPIAGAATLTADIIHIDFGDSLHGKVLTANRESWTTSDAGRSWQKQ